MDLPTALTLYRAEARVHPWDSARATLLAETRAEVHGPAPWEPQELPVPAWAWTIVYLLALAFAVSNLRRARYLRGAFGGIVVVCCFLGWRMSQQPDEGYVLRQASTLHTGNGTAFPRRLPDVLPVGTEVRLLHLRSGRPTWAQVELGDGTIGWVDLGERPLTEPVD